MLKDFYSEQISAKCWIQKDLVPKKLGWKNESKQVWTKKIGLKKLFGPRKLDKKKIWVKKIFGSHGPIFKVWLELGYSIRFKLGQMLHEQMFNGQMLHGQMFPRKLTTHTDVLIIKFG